MVETLSYEPVAPPRLVPPPPRGLKACLVVGSLGILLALLVALPPLAGALDYTRDIPLSEAIEYSLDADWSEVLTHPWATGLVLLIPLEIAALVAFVLARPAWLTRVAFWVGLLAPFACAGRFAPFLPLITIMTLPAWVGRDDGETWSEGFVAMGCAGAWSMLWATAGCYLLVRRVRGVKRASSPS